MKLFLIMFSVFFLFCDQLWAAQSDEESPPDFQFDYSDISVFYGNGFIDFYYKERPDTSRVEVSCQIPFPYSFPAPKFLNSFDKDDVEYSTPCETSPVALFCYPEDALTFEDEFNEEKMIATRTWTATNAEGKTTKHYFIVEFFGFYDQASLNNVLITKSDSNPINLNDGGTLKICPNEEIELFADSSTDCVNSRLYINWDLDGDLTEDVETIGEERLKYTWEQSGIYEVRIAAHYLNSSSGSDTLNFIVKVGLEYDIQVTHPECKEENTGRIKVTANDVGTQVSINNVKTSEVENLVTGNYTIKLINEDGCEATEEIEITYTNRAVFNAQNGTIDLSKNEELVLENLTNNTNILTWDFGDGETIQSKEPIVKHTYKDIGTYEVTLTSETENCIDTMIKTITVIRSEFVKVEISSEEESPTFSDPIPIIITFSKPVSGFDQQDIVVNGGIIESFEGSGDRYDLEIKPAQDGTITVDIPADVAMDALGNLNTAASTFSIQFVNNITAFEKPGQENDLIYYVFNNNLEIRNPEKRRVTASLISLTGKKTLVFQVYDSYNTIALPGLHSVIYILLIETANETRYKRIFLE